MHAQQEEALLLLVVAVVGVEHFADLAHDVARLHGAGGPHTPGEAEGARFVFPFLIPRYVATVERREWEEKWFRKEVSGGFYVKDRV